MAAPERALSASGMSRIVDLQCGYDYVADLRNPGMPCCPRRSPVARLVDLGMPSELPLMRQTKTPGRVNSRWLQARNLNLRQGR